jgi:hypothetical protein
MWTEAGETRRLDLMGSLLRVHVSRGFALSAVVTLASAVDLGLHPGVRLFLYI